MGTEVRARDEIARAMEALREVEDARRDYAAAMRLEREGAAERRAEAARRLVAAERRHRAAVESVRSALGPQADPEGDAAPHLAHGIAVASAVTAGIAAVVLVVVGPPALRAMSLLSLLACAAWLLRYA